MDYIVELVGDENDGDYIKSQRIVGSLGNIAIEADFLFKGNKVYTYLDWLPLLAKAFMKTSGDNENAHDKHNWCRDEYDFDRDYKHRTCSNLLVLMGFNEGDFSDEEVDTIYEGVAEYLGDFLPFGECGIHTLTEIKTYPKPVVKDYMM